MSCSNASHRKAPIAIAGLLACLSILVGCSGQQPNRVQGYVEGEFVYVASPFPGQLEALYVQRGAQVKTGDPLFALDASAETAARNEAARRLAQGRANLEDAKKGRRPTEIESLEAQLKQARAQLEFSEIEFQRQEKLIRSDSVAMQAFDRARSQRDQDRQRVARPETAPFPAREKTSWPYQDCRSGG
jgi:HlyD family secretion protein